MPPLLLIDFYVRSVTVWGTPDLVCLLSVASAGVVENHYSQQPLPVLGEPEVSCTRDRQIRVQDLPNSLYIGLSYGNSPGPESYNTRTLMSTS